ncbi:MAG: NAD-dependent epimerase/dehydratase family protein [Candidatus Micrarchaeota archaeon]
MPSYLVTGATGYIGGMFARFLRKERPRAEVLGIGRGRCGIGGMECLEIDLTDVKATEEAVSDFSPDFIFHLAGVPYSEDWGALLAGNVKTTISVLEAAAKLGKGRVVVVGSAAEYGRVEGADLPIKETQALKPLSRYGISMACRGAITRGFSAMGCDAVLGRLFNPIGPGLGENFALGSFAKQIRAISSGTQKAEMLVGNLKAKRDFIDTEDACRAFLALAEKGKRGEDYNICSGRSYVLSGLLDMMLKEMGLEAEIKVEQGRIRKGEVADVRGSTDKISKDTGWKPQVPIEESVRRLLA